MPEDRLYELDSEVWLRRDPSGSTASIGILATLGAFVGRFTSVTFRPGDGPLPRGRSVATLESVRSVGPLRLPVDGTVVERNLGLLERPKLLNDDPYDAGWVVRLSIPPMPWPPPGLAPAAAIAGPLAERIHRLRIRCFPAVPDSEMYEIGAECQAILVRLDEEIARRSPGEVVHLVTDDPTAPIEMVRWTDRTGHVVIDHRREETLHHFLVRKNPPPNSDPRPG